MPKAVLRLLKNSWLPIILLAIFIIPSFISMVRPGFFPMQDDLQAFRIFELNKCWANFQFPCRWIPDAGYGYGYPLFNYYSPLVYYLGSFIHLLGFQVIDAVKILFALGFLLSGIFMYILVKEFSNKWGAFVAALLFVYVPFRAAEVYVRGSLAEFFVISFFPLTFWASYKLIEKKESKYFILLAISLALLPLTHNLLPIVFAPILILWIGYWLLVKKDSKSFLKVFLSSLLGIGLSAFFLIPLVFEQQFVHTETLLGGYFDYRQHFVSFAQLFFSNNWGYGSSYLGIEKDLALSTGIVHWILAAIGLIFSIVFYSKNKKISRLIAILFGANIVYLFLIHQKSSFVWNLIPVLKWLQFPWRLLALTTFIFSLIIGISFSYIKKNIVLFGISSIILIGILYLGFFRPSSWINISDLDKFSGISWQKQLTISIFDYLPIYAVKPPEFEANDYPEVISGSVEFLDYKKGSYFQTGTAIVKKDSVIRVPLYDFPGMAVYLNDVKIPHRHDVCIGQKDCLGLVSFDIPVGSNKILVRLENTWPRTLGNIISFVSVLLVLFSLGSNIYAQKNTSKN